MIFKRLMDVFSKGELIKIKATGEVFVYESSTGGANFKSYLTVNVRSNVFEYAKSFHVDEVLKVDVDGLTIDDFSQYRSE